MSARTATITKRFMLGAGVVALGLLAGTARAAGIQSQTAMQHNSAARFSLRDLKGSCVWQSASIKTDRSTALAEPATMIARASFDGNGNVMLTHARTNFDGIVTDQSYSGTYAVNPDGDGTITFNFANPVSQPIYDFQFSDSRRVLRFMRELDMKPEPVGSSSAAITSSRLSIGVCNLAE
jgi:hypothetical protein